MLKGSIVALVTPMHENNEVDYTALQKLIEFHITNKTSAIIPVGTTGESATLSHEEDRLVTQKVIEYANGRIPVIAGTGSNSTQEAVELTISAEKAGADAALVVVPYYNRPPQEGIYQHFSNIAQSVDIPIILYNVPKRTSSDISLDTVARLAKIKNIIGIKDATGDISRVGPMKEQCGEDFMLYSGDDPSFCDYMINGGHGVISVVANIIPAQIQQICHYVLNGEIEKANELDQRIQKVYDAIGCEVNPIPVKWALYEMDMIDRGIRLPLIPLDESKRPLISEVLQTI